MRADHEFPQAITDWGWRFHHLGVPTEEVRPDERHIPHLRFSVSGFPNSPYGVEWMRFDDDTEFHPLIQTVPHLAFVVDDLELELAHRDLTVLTPPNEPSEGLRVAMVEHDGAPIELMEFSGDSATAFMHVLLLGRTGVVLDDVAAMIDTSSIMLHAATSFEEVQSVMAETPIHTVIMGAGIELDSRLAIVRHIFENSTSTKVHMKDWDSGPAGMIPFVNSALTRRNTYGERGR